MIKKLSCILAFIFFSSTALCSTALATEGVVLKGFSPEELEFMAEENQKLNEQPQREDSLLSNAGPKLNLVTSRVRPYAEYENQGYFIFNDETHFNSLSVKIAFLENLPKGVEPLIYTLNQSPEFVQSLKETFGPYLKNPELLEVKFFNYEKIGVSRNGFWSRDAIPVPVFLENNGKKIFSVVDARYYHRYEPDKDVAKHFDAALFSHNYYFEGGNFIANSRGDCLVVNTVATNKIPNHIFKSYYGCSNLIRLPFIKGIGHADESVKFFDENLVGTDDERYEKILKAEGFVVVRIPRAKQKYETYMNSVILNDVVYVPTFGRVKEDEEALQAYRNLGYRAVPMNSYLLSNRGSGSLHCISMVYPKL